MFHGCIHRQASPQTPQGFHTCFLSPLFPMSWFFEQATKLQIDYPCFVVIVARIFLVFTVLLVFTVSHLIVISSFSLACGSVIYMADTLSRQS